MFMKENFNKAKKERGFSLLGVVVSLFLVTVGLLGFTGLFSAMEALSAQNKNDLVAGFLAQEGIEIVRRIRENASELNWSDWHSSVSSGDYSVQYDSSDLEPFQSAPLKFDQNTFVYSYDSGNNSLFYRTVRLQKVDDDQTVVSVIISWSSKGNNYSLTLEDILYNWIKE